MIGATGKKLHMLSSHVAWSQMALEAAKAEGKPASYISKIKKIVSQGKQAHDEVKLSMSGTSHGVEAIIKFE